MSIRVLIFVGWCGLLLLFAALASIYAYSPFADAHHGRGGGGGHGGHGSAYYGPMHK